MKKSIKKIAKNLHIFAKAEIIQAVNKYYDNDERDQRVKLALARQNWKDLEKCHKKYFYYKAILILTK